MHRTISPADALQRLIDGNRRYAADESPEDMHSHAVSRRLSIDDQHPFAIVLGCSDSRVPIEIVFGQGLGDLFVIRVAGNILNDHVIGSIEYAIEMFGSPLVVVLGHSKCGAVTAAVEAVSSGRDPHARIATIVEAIRPAIQPIGDEEDPIEMAIAQNVRSVTAVLQHTEPIIAGARSLARVAVVGGVYHLSTGLVSLLCGDLAGR